METTRPPKLPTVQLTLRVTTDIYRRIEADAIAQDRSMNQMAAILLKTHYATIDAAASTDQ